MRIRIVSKRDGFRRAGIAHPSSPTFYPAKHFKPEQLEQLKAEPMLVVDEVPDEEPAKSKGGAKSDGGKTDGGKTDGGQKSDEQ